MFDTSLQQHAAHAPIRQRVVKLRTKLDAGLEGVTAEEARLRVKETFAAIEHVATKSELNGPVYEDLVQLKAIYSRYQNYLNWKERS